MVGFVQTINGGQSIEKHEVQCFYGILNEATAGLSQKKDKKVVGANNKTQQSTNSTSLTTANNTEHVAPVAQK